MKPWIFRDFEWPFPQNGQKYWHIFFVIFIQDYVLLILVEFDIEKSTRKITLRKKNSCLCDTFEIFVNFEISPIFEILNGHFGEMVKNISNFFFVIFIQDNVLFILVEFESDQISPCESAKNGRIGAYGLKYNFFFNFELIFEIYDKNYLRKLP